MILNRLNSTNLKIIALVIMTIDHIAAYGNNIFSFLPYDILRSIGRSAAPLFMFALVIGAGHTKSKGKFLLRLYIASLIIFAAWAVLFLSFGGYFASMPSVLSTYLYVLIYGFGLEKTISELKKRKPAALLYLAALAAVTVLPVLFFDRAYGYFAGMITGEPTERNAVLSVLWEFLRTVIPNVKNVDYSAYFVLMGVMWYFVKNKYACAGILVLFSAFSWFGTYGWVMIERFDFLSDFMRLYYPLDFFAQGQFYMVFAALFILLYNGQRGKGLKWFFYGYYPLHVFVISAVNNLITS